MNAYEEKQEARRQRLLKRAGKKRSQSDRLFEAGTSALKEIPFGQPILTDHYSAKSDRAYRGRAVRKIEKSFEASDEAKELEARAASVGTGGVSSDDPDAVEKLEQKLALLEEAHKKMKEMNAKARKEGEEKPFPAYMLSNSNANIKSVKKRISDLKALSDRPEFEPVIGNGWKMYEDREANRIVIEFDERQPQEITQLVKSRGFLWARSRGAWVRKITVNALHSARRLSNQLKETL